MHIYPKKESRELIKVIEKLLPNAKRWSVLTKIWRSLKTEQSRGRGTFSLLIVFRPFQMGLFQIMAGLKNKIKAWKSLGWDSPSL
jgi:hypothetical protein